MKIFISHSSRDVKIAGLLIDLLRFALNLRSEDLRCTSVEGYRLPGGASTDEVLRREVHDAQLFIGLITRDSIDSAYVLFELGARWGARKTLIPLLASGASSEHLRGPLSGINALSCSVPDQIYQFIEEAAKHLSVSPSAPSTYQKALTALVSASSAVQEPSSTVPRTADPKLASGFTDDEVQILRTLASNEVDSDREMSLTKLSSLLLMPRLKVEVLIEKLQGDVLVDHLTGNASHVGLTRDGARFAVRTGLV